MRPNEANLCPPSLDPTHPESVRARLICFVRARADADRRRREDGLQQKYWRDIRIRLPALLGEDPFPSKHTPLPEG